MLVSKHVPRRRVTLPVRPRRVGHFVRHYFEMCIPMCVGFAVGDIVYFWAFGVRGFLTLNPQRQLPLAPGLIERQPHHLRRILGAYRIEFVVV